MKIVLKMKKNPYNTLLNNIVTAWISNICNSSSGYRRMISRFYVK